MLGRQCQTADVPVFTIVRFDQIQYCSGYHAGLGKINTFVIQVACYRNNWHSDISFWVNGIELCTWRCPEDSGDIALFYNPAEPLNLTVCEQALLSGLTFAVHVFLLSIFKNKDISEFKLSFCASVMLAIADSILIAMTDKGKSQ